MRPNLLDLNSIELCLEKNEYLFDKNETIFFNRKTKQSMVSSVLKNVKSQFKKPVKILKEKNNIKEKIKVENVELPFYLTESDEIVFSTIMNNEKKDNKNYFKCIYWNCEKNFGDEDSFLNHLSEHCICSNNNNNNNNIISCELCHCVFNVPSHHHHHMFMDHGIIIDK
jgi:hypothetical protein